ncbi:MAG: hypothetical protein J0H11_13565 [Rhizobiales bacterium]|nr:hypothetical protein [Hyphomicrobiales bacterium]
MDLADIHANARDQDRGRAFEIVDPFEGKPTGLKFTVAGPDSETSRRARLRMADDLAEAAGADGRVSADARESARLHCLAAHILRWDVAEDGKPVPLNTKNAVTVLRVAWIAAQVDAFLSDRRNFKPEA